MRRGESGPNAGVLLRTVLLLPMASTASSTKVQLSNLSSEPGLG